MTETKTMFEKLAAVDVNAHVDKKNTGTQVLSYLSWAWAWDYFKKAHPDAKYEIKEWEGKPYLFDEKTGYMVETSITAGGETHIMWLPVMDNANHAMLDKPRTIQTKYKSIDVASATMFDINKTIMRCLVKNMAMFGLGLYIYAGEDLPTDGEAADTKESSPVKITDKQKQDLVALGANIPELCKYFQVENVDDLSYVQARQAINAKKRQGV